MNQKKEDNQKKEEVIFDFEFKMETPEEKK
jgi:hypothetical protein